MTLNGSWNRVPIESVYLGLYDGPHATPRPAAEGPVFLGIKNITEDGRLDLTEIRHIAEEDYPKWTQRVEPKPGDIVFTYEATLHRYAIIPQGFRGCLGRRLALIRPNPDVADHRFLFYYFFSQDWRETVGKHILLGSTVDRIPISKFPTFDINLPPLPVQRKIADILSAYDDLIENNTRRIRILEEMARAIYREWFIHFRFPGHEKVKLVDSPLGKIPEGWEVKKLGDLCTRITDGSHSSPKSVDVGYPMASVKDMTDWGLNEETCRRIAETDYRDLVRNNCKPLLNDVLIAKDGSYLKHVFVVEQEKELVILSSIAILRPNLQRILPHVLRTYLRQPEIRGRLSGYVSGVALPRIILKDFAKFLVLVPTLSLQQQFMDLAGPPLRLVQSLFRKNAHLGTARNLLLPRLISGDLEVQGDGDPVSVSAGGLTRLLK